jgi:predicted nucleic acid-binding protein
VILDTSAVIGLLELDAAAAGILGAIREAGGRERPAIHAVTLGELSAGVHKAIDDLGEGSLEAVVRRRTLGAARDRRRFSAYGIDTATWQMFGEISGRIGRRVGHNDKWITASAIANERALITQDATLAERADGVLGLRVFYVER